MSIRLSQSVLLPDGRTLYLQQQHHESSADFSGRALCLIEEAITGKRGPTPKGIRWAVWYHDGYPLGRYHTNGLGRIAESTGNPYADRVIDVPGIYDEDEARKLLGL